MKVAILGAGLVGCLLGGALANAGAQVMLIGRGRYRAITDHGMAVKFLDGRRFALPAGTVTYGDDPALLGDADCILVCVKSQQTGEAARIIASHGRKAASVISFQNGTGNGAVLTESLAGMSVASGMVGFNVIEAGEGMVPTFIQTTQGEVVAGREGLAPQIISLLEKAGIAAHTHGDMEAVLWSKLCLNLNNALNALSGLPLRQQLLDRDARRVLAACMQEALAVMKARGIKPVRIGKVDPRLGPYVLRLPTPLFRIVAAGMLKIGEEARSSMWEDLQAGRGSEVAFLNGAIAREAEARGMEASVNKAVTKAVEEAFAAGRSPMMRGKALLALAGRDGG